jgi:predicted AlkP superfamily phosphohydrolase/phosphomutase
MKRPLATLVAILLLSFACAREPEPPAIRPVVLVGIDGASWIAIKELWRQGRLPNLRSLAQRGATSELTPVADFSPIIWTSFVTGVRPSRHGITDFLLPTEQGDIPVSSSNRRVPAIWNMLTTVGRRVAVLGWWVSWPAESVNGVVVSDRALRTTEGAVSPKEFAPRFAQVVRQFPLDPETDFQGEIGRQDEVIAATARELLGEGFDLTLVYLRGPDVVSHPYWKYFLPPETEEVSPEKIQKYGERVPEAYEAVDRLLGDLIAAAPEETNIFVTSDHGFTSVEGQEYRMLVDLNRVLEHLGYLVRVDGEIDWHRSRAVTWNSPPGLPEKMVRVGLTDRDPPGPVAPGDLSEVVGRLAMELAEVVHKNGAPVFNTRQPRSRQRQQGADLMVRVHQRKKARDMFFRGEEIPGVIERVEELTGTHSVETKGIFIAAGPDIDPTFGARAVHSLDITPTLLYALGLPVAEDFDGKARTRLFRAEFREAHPLKTVPSWGEAEEGVATASEIDEELKEELRALGYIN